MIKITKNTKNINLIIKYFRNDYLSKDEITIIENNNIIKYLDNIIEIDLSNANNSINHLMCLKAYCDNWVYKQLNKKL